jgi:hypothetical protein
MGRRAAAVHASASMAGVPKFTTPRSGDLLSILNPPRTWSDARRLSILNRHGLFRSPSPDLRQYHPQIWGNRAHRFGRMSPSDLKQSHLQIWGNISLRFESIASLKFEAMSAKRSTRVTFCVHCRAIVSLRFWRWILLNLGEWPCWWREIQIFQGIGIGLKDQEFSESEIQYDRVFNWPQMHHKGCNLLDCPECGCSFQTGKWLSRFPLLTITSSWGWSSFSKIRSYPYQLILLPTQWNCMTFFPIKRMGLSSDFSGKISQCWIWLRVDLELCWYPGNIVRLFRIWVVLDDTISRSSIERDNVRCRLMLLSIRRFVQDVAELLDQIWASHNQAEADFSRPLSSDFVHQAQ